MLSEPISVVSLRAYCSYPLCRSCFTALPWRDFMELIQWTAWRIRLPRTSITTQLTITPQSTFTNTRITTVTEHLIMPN